MRALVLSRVSHASQVEGYSLDAQQAELQRWCESRGYTIAHSLVEEGVSARTDTLEKRPLLRQALEMAGRSEYDLLVVHTLDRIARNQKIQRYVLETLGKAGVGFASVVEGIDYTTPTGKLVMSVMGSVHEFFSDQLAVHVSKAAKQRAEVGLPVGPLPFGYKPAEPGEPPAIVPDEAEALVTAFTARALGESMGEIAGSLNAAGFRTREGRQFTAHAIRDILENPFFCGIVRYKGREFPAKHMPLITKDLFRRVQARRGGTKPPRKTWGNAGVLQGAIACGNCGSGIQSDRHRLGGAMYRERHSNECVTNGKSAVVQPFDDQVGQIITSITLPDEWQERMTELMTCSYHGPSLNDLLEKRRRLGVAYADGMFTEREYKARLKDIDAQITEARAVVPPSYEEAAALLMDLDALWKEATPEERRKLVSPLIERVYVDMELKLVGAITPTPAFRALLQCAIRKSDSPVWVGSQDEMEELGVWSWWRRGRIELPVQKKYVQDLLQAYPGI